MTGGFRLRDKFHYQTKNNLGTLIPPIRSEINALAIFFQMGSFKILFFIYTCYTYERLYMVFTLAGLIFKTQCTWLIKSTMVTPHPKLYRDTKN